MCTLWLWCLGFCFRTVLEVRLADEAGYSLSLLWNDSWLLSMAAHMNTRSGSHRGIPSLAMTEHRPSALVIGNTIHCSHSLPMTSCFENSVTVITAAPIFHRWCLEEDFCSFSRKGYLAFPCLHCCLSGVTTVWVRQKVLTSYCP